jgi:hypothetical protein
MMRDTPLAGAFTLACVLPHEAKVRFVNYETRGNYNISLIPEAVAAGSQEPSASPPEVTALAYHPYEHVLAVALSNAEVRCFQHIHEGRCGLCYWLTQVCIDSSIARPISPLLGHRC